MSRLYGVAGANSSDVVSVSTNAGLNTPEPYTMVIWGYPNSIGKTVTGAVGRLMVRDSGAVTGYFIWRHNSTATMTNQISLFENFAVTDLEVTTTSNAFALSRWNHYAVTWDGTSTAANGKIYVQGSEPASYVSRTNGVGALSLDTSPKFTVGNRGSLIASYDGTLAFGAIYGFVMTSNQILHELLFPGSHNYPSAKAVWPLYGSAIEGDYSGNQNNGTVSGPTVGLLQPPINGVAVTPCPGWI